MNITKVYLLDVPLEKDYKNSLYFANKNAQYNYFNSKAVKKYTDFTYQRKDKFIRVPDDYDTIANCNYVMYQNSAQNNKWFYAFVEKIEYNSNGRSDVYISTDVIQTYLFDYTVKPSFVEREHVSDDTVGSHTLPEGLETGEYICSSKMSLYSGGNTSYICVASTNTPIDIGTNPYIRQYNGIYGGLYYTIFETPYNASKFLLALDRNSQGDAVASVFMIPTELCGNITFTHYSPETPAGSDVHTEFDAGVLPYTTEEVLLTSTSSITRPTTIDGYTPKNNKLFTYPYCYFYVSNNVGTDVEFHYEDFVNNTASFKTIGAVTPGCSIKCYPLNYKKLSDTSTSMKSYNYGISAAKYPVCSWVSDVYTNWLTQNGVNIAGVFLNAEQKKYVSAAVEIAGGTAALAAGNPVGLVNLGGGVSDVLNTMNESYMHRLMPDQSKGNANSGDITFASDNMDIPLFKMNVRSEYAKIIDQYFSMYGYKVNTVKVPNSNHRQRWWYTKTLNVNIVGAIPNEDLDRIRTCYNNGITFWKNADEMYEYTLSNNIVS